MIRRLRARHRETFVILAVVLPVGLALALRARTSAPVDSSSLRAEFELHAPAAPPLREGLVRRASLEVRYRLWEASAQRGRVLELAPQRDLAAPDVLAYWADSGGTDSLPEHCVLLGPVAGARSRCFELPHGARGGRIHLYSLGHQELLASEELPP